MRFIGVYTREVTFVLFKFNEITLPIRYLTPPSQLDLLLKGPFSLRAIDLQTLST